MDRILDLPQLDPSTPPPGGIASAEEAIPEGSHPSEQACRYSAATAAALTGLSRRQLEYWDEQGLICPTRAAGQRRRTYDFFQLLCLYVLSRLQDEGRISLARVEAVIRAMAGLRERGVGSHLLISDHSQAFWTHADPRSVFERLHNGQVVLAVPLRRLEALLRDRLRELGLPCPP